MSIYTYNDQTVSDLHNAAYGVPAGWRFMHLWDSLSRDDKQGMWEAMRNAVKV